MMPVPISNGFTIDATPILIFGALVVAGYVVLNIKRMLSKENTVNETTTINDEVVTSVKTDNIKTNTNTSQNSSEDVEEDIYENYENNEEVFTLNRR